MKRKRGEVACLIKVQKYVKGLYSKGLQGRAIEKDNNLK
jgi:hypothetical protein